MNISLGKYLFKVNNKETKAKSASVFVVSLLLTLNRYIAPVRFGFLASKINNKYMPKVKVKDINLRFVQNDVKSPE